MPRRGTQSIHRSVTLLKAVAERKDIGWRLGDLADYCDLEKTTAHRMLKCLVDEGMLRQRVDDRRYIPGPLMFELASSLPAYMDFRDALHPELEDMARHHNGVAFLHLRSGNETVCIDRVGDAEVNPFTVTGTRRPLSLSTAGVAILLALSERERREVMAGMQIRIQTESQQRRVAVYRKILRQSARFGYSFSLGDVVPGLGAIAAPLLDAAGKPFAAIGLMGPIEQFTEGRQQKLVAALTRDAQRITREQANRMREMLPKLPDAGKRHQAP